MTRQWYYDINTKPISLEELCKLCEDDSYRVIANESIGHYEISTIWMGLNHSIFPDAPLIFETMIFCENKEDELHMYQDRCSDLEQAYKMHGIATAICRETIKKRQGNV